MDYKLIALDLDGTLFSDNLTVSPRVRRALELAMARGVRVTLASGRGYPSMLRWVGELGITTPVICYQGAAITQPMGAKRLYERTFSRAIVGELSAFARRCRLSLIMYVGDEIWVENKLHSDAFYDKWFGLPYHLVDDLASALEHEPLKAMFIGSETELDAVQAEVERRFGDRLQVARSHPFFLEGTAPGATKGAALAWLAARLGIAREQTMAIGDSDNDRDMIAWAGLGVAMGNASPPIRAIAAYVAPPVEEDGAAEAIERFCL